MLISCPLLPRCIGACAIVFLLAAATAGGEPEEHEFLVAGYLPDYRSVDLLDKAAPHLSDVLLFSVSPASDGAASGPGVCCLHDEHYARAREARTKANPKLRLLASVGGAGRSQNLASIASDASRRAAFIANLLELCETEGLDGIDFDWEPPPSQSQTQTREQSERYLRLLLLEAGRALRPAGKLLSVALHPGQGLSPQLYRVVDRVHLMAYDMITSTGGRGAQHHAALGDAKRAVDALIDSGCPANKIVLGIPAYARHGDDPGLVRTYSEIVDDALAGKDAPPAAAEPGTSSCSSGLAAAAAAAAAAVMEEMDKQ